MQLFIQAIMFYAIFSICNNVIAQTSVIDGEDYTLPEWVTVSPYSGYGGSNPDGVIITQKNWHVSWAQLEPERGQYNWELVESEMTKAREGGYSISMHITSIVVGGVDPNNNNKALRNDVPNWVFTELNAPTDTLSWTFNLEVIPGWREDIRDAFNTLIREFGKQGYPQRPELGSAYIHGISLSRGEEFFMQKEMADRIRQTLGFTREAVDAWIRTRIDAYAEAFGDVAYKLAWVGNMKSFNFDPYKGMSEDLMNYAWEKGAGNRGGGVEWYNGRLNDGAFGQWVTEDGYLTTDETIPPIATVRYFGEENEEYGPYWPWRWGPEEEHPYRCRMATFRGLQIMFRWMWISEHTQAQNPPLFEYNRMSMGKSVETTPDAWAYLREAKVYPNPGVLKNFERWLYQRDVDSAGMTTNDRKLTYSYDPGGTTNYDYTARRTAVYSGQRYIYFDLDDRFKIDGPIDIKVEIYDNSTAGMRIEYNTEQAADTPTEWVVGQQDLAIRTVTFTIPGAKFSNALPGGMDFRIASNLRGDVTVRWVRVVRHALPDIETSLPDAQSALPEQMQLEQNYPNPFNPKTTIRFSLPQAGRAQLAVFDLLGRKVRTLFDDVMPQGSHVQKWDGRLTSGLPAASGVYLIQLRTANAIRVQKALLLR
jgi:hypothetical protein